MKKKRLRSFDALKFFAIFLVVWGHSIAWFSNRDPAQGWAFRFIYSFHMPLFMTISGFFSAKLLDKPIKSVFKDRCLPLLVPTLTLGVAVSLFEWWVSGTAFIDSVALSFWFLVSLSLCTLLYRLTMHGRKHLVMKFFVGLVISQILPPLVKYDFNIGTMYPCFLLGVLLAGNFDFFKRNVRVIFGVSFVCFLIMLCFLTPESFDMKFDRSHGIGPIVDYAYKYAFRLAIGFCGAVASISFFEIMASVVPVTDFGDRICAMGKDTLAIYVISGVIVHTFIMKLVNLDYFNVIMYQFIITPIIAYITIEACVWLSKLIHKSKVLSFLLFGKIS